MVLPTLPPRSFWIGIIAIGLAGCADTPGEISRDSKPFDGIDEAEVIDVGGTEPFWALTIIPDGDGYQAKYSTPDLIDGEVFSLTRFAGNNGLGFSGNWAEVEVTLALTPGDCSDGMSDRTYPYTATLLLGDETLYGCAHTDTQPFVGGEGAP